MELFLLGKILAYFVSFYAIFLLVDSLRRKGNTDDSTKQEKSDTFSENKQKEQEWSPEQEANAAIILLVGAIILFALSLAFSKFILPKLPNL